MAEEVVFLVLYIAMSCVFTLFGIIGLRYPDQTSSFFQSFGTRLYGSKTAERIYTPKNLRWATVPFVIVGPIFAVIGVFGLVRVLTG
ncbi:MAG: hypothetical protein Q7J04_00865 [Microcella sp.]|nr:hypothetical protein [Microcella sp.]